MCFEVTLGGNFLKEIKVEAKSHKEAEKLAKEQFDKTIGLMPEDYIIDSVMTAPVHTIDDNSGI